MAHLGDVGRLIFDTKTLYGGEISGTVLGPASAPVVRRVMAIERSTGKFSGSALSNQTTGAYWLGTALAIGKTPHIVIELDDAAGEAYNARVFDNVIPL